MKLFDETKEIFNTKIKLLEKEIEPYYNADNEQSYMLVSFIFREIQDFIYTYVQEHPTAYTLEENDDIEIEDANDVEEYSVMYIAKNILPAYLETLSVLSTTYDYDAYAKYSAHEYGKINLDEIHKEKQNLMHKLTHI